MTIQHKLVALKANVTALVADRDYYRDKCGRQEAILEEIKEMIINSNQTTDEILAVINRDSVKSLSLILNDPTVLDIPLFPLFDEDTEEGKK